MITRKRTIGLQLTTSNQDIYTVPAQHEAEIKSIIISNDTSNTVTFSLDWYKSSNTTYYTIAEATQLLPNGIIQIEDSLYLFKGDVIRGLASANTSVTVTIKVNEDYIPKQFA
jgi:hypothetical protein